MKKTLIALLVFVTISGFLIKDNKQIDDGLSIIKKVNARDEGERLSQNVFIKMMDRRGKTQERELAFYRNDYSDQRKSVIFYKSPANVKGTSFLTYDYQSTAKDDDQWLYLPALRKTRRISAANRGDYFLGTDLTYEDVKLGTKIGESDYNFKFIENSQLDGADILIVDGTPKSDKIKKELGYSKVKYWIDKEIMFPRKIEYWDVAGNKLKVVEFKDVKKVQDIWTVHRIEAENIKTNHKTTFLFNQLDYQTKLEEELFTEESMIRGL